MKQALQPIKAAMNPKKLEAQGLIGLQTSGILILLMVPATLFYIFIGQTWLAIALTITGLLSVSFFRIIKSACADTLADRALLLVICLMVGLTLTTLGGEGRILPATTDWIVRDAVLHDLVSRHWPFVYQISGENWILRAPLGMYLIPAIAGKIFGLYAAYLALWFQNSIAVGMILWILSRAETRKISLVVLSVFCLFSGWDIVGSLFISAIHEIAFHTPARWPVDIGWWNGLLQYSSTTTLILWVPNHALAGWFFVSLLLLWERGELRISALMMGALLTVLWSPFALIGALPFMVKAGAAALWQRRFGIDDFGVPTLLAILTVPLILYLKSDTGGVPHAFQAPAANGFVLIYIMFTTVEVLPFAIFNFIGRRYHGGFLCSTYYLSVAILFAIPFYKIGAENDFVMRASIPSLAIMAVTTGHTVSGFLRQRRLSTIFAVAIVLGLSAFTGLDQIWHVLNAPNNGISTCNFVQAWRQDLSGQINTSSMAPYLAEESHLHKWPQPLKPEIYVTSPITSSCVRQRL